MNGNEFSRLSYKELQALALRYRVPGNIKKKLLVKVLQAAKGGNDNEVGRLLQDLKQNRKKRVRKLPAGGKLGITSTPVHSPNYVMADDYYCPQQEPPYQWVAAEEEIVSRDEEGRIPDYEEFKQFLLRKIQRDFKTYDTNNNQLHDSTIVDLRTVVPSSNMQPVNIDTVDYARSSIITVNNTESYIYPPNDKVEYHTVEDVNGNAEGSILLKKMLQAPLGANLGEIASPVVGSYRLWPVEQYQSNNLLDNSDTLTAESDTQETETNLDNNVECYGLLSALNADNINQYKYSTSGLDTRQDFDNWNINNPVDSSEIPSAATDMHSSKIFQTMYYENAGPDNLNKHVQDDNISSQYRIMESPYNSSQNLLNLNAQDGTPYYDTNIITTIQSDSSNTYYLQNLAKCNTDTTGEYFNNMQPISTVPPEQDVYASTVSQAFQNNNHYSPSVSYEYPSSSQITNTQMSEKLQQSQQHQQHQQNHADNMGRQDIGQVREVPGDRLQMNGVLDPFFPKWPLKPSSDPALENILNLPSTRRMDLARLEQTSCVYCYVPPIMSHTPVTVGAACSQKEKFMAEYRQHSFSAYGLLYDDTTNGMRMANLQSSNTDGNSEHCHLQTMQQHAAANGNSDGRLSSEHGESEDSINETWAQNYTNYEVEIEKGDRVGMNVGSTDCLFPVISADALDNAIEPLTLGEAQQI